MRILATIVAIVCGLIVLVDYFISWPPLDTLAASLVEGVAILSVFALLLGTGNLLRIHSQGLVQRDGQRGFRIILLVALLATLVIGLWPNIDLLPWVFEYVYQPLESTMVALLSFFMVGALYKAFRLSRPSAILLLISCLFFLITQIPFSASLSSYLPAMGRWMLMVPVTATVRGMLIGVALGTIASCLRILAAIDRPYTGSQEPDK